MEQTIIEPGETTGGLGACSHPVLEVVAGGWRCTRCHVLITNSAA